MDLGGPALSGPFFVGPCPSATGLGRGRSARLPALSPGSEQLNTFLLYRHPYNEDRDTGRNSWLDANGAQG